jgi:HAD superfamily hydrolase (TIGR01509 family)
VVGVPTHIIFDCDGVLVDSEMLSAGVLMAMMEEIGLPITEEIFRTDFLGRSFASAAVRVTERFGRAMPEDFQLQYRTRLLAKLRTDLKLMPGVKDMMAGLRAPFWLATGSSPARLAVSLESTGLEQWFAGRCSTIADVQQGKPAPDLPLLAASKLDVAPEHCLVIEDSEMGILAAQAAGMEVWHFTGGAHFANGYRLPPDVIPGRVVASMAELRVLFTALDLC